MESNSPSWVWLREAICETIPYTLFLWLERENAVPVKSCLHLALLSKVKKAIGLRFFTEDMRGVDILLPNRVRTKRKVYTFVVWNKRLASVQARFYKGIIYFELPVNQRWNAHVWIQGPSCILLWVFTLFSVALLMKEGMLPCRWQDSARSGSPIGNNNQVGVLGGGGWVGCCCFLIMPISALFISD